MFRSASVLALLLVLLVLGENLRAQGVALSGIGPVNRSMGGAATAAPIDSFGALYWNPATIVALPASDCSIALEAVLPKSNLSSQFDAGSLGPGVPAVTLAGNTGGKSGVAPVPAMAFVHKPEEKCWAIGFGLFGVGGFNGNYPASATNPILTPPLPNGLGMGHLTAQLDILQMTPTVAWVLSENISVGVAPTVTLARLVASPAFFGTPDDADGDGYFSYPDASGTLYHWGAGFQAGVYYTTDVGWHLGACLKSPQWFETFRFESEDELGRPQQYQADFDYPLIVSVGAAYSGFDKTMLACDLRYFDYAGAAGFGDCGFLASGAAAGLGWRSVMAVSTGIERRLTDRFSVRFGYALNENPIPSCQAGANMTSSLIIKHWLTGGLSWRVTDHWMLSLAYVHGFQNEISGPVLTPSGPVPGTRITETAYLDSLVAGVSVRF